MYAVLNRPALENLDNIWNSVQPWRNINKRGTDDVSSDLSKDSIETRNFSSN